jgi:hypothetical protein
VCLSPVLLKTMFFQNLHAFLRETQGIVLWGCGDNDQQAQYYWKTGLIVHLLTEHHMVHISPLSYSKIQWSTHAYFTCSLCHLNENGSHH